MKINILLENETLEINIESKSSIVELYKAVYAKYFENNSIRCDKSPTGYEFILFFDDKTITRELNQLGIKKYKLNETIAKYNIKEGDILHLKMSQKKSF